jgi:glucokinase
MLAGGILPQIEEFLWQSEFKMRFLRKGVMTPFLRRVPVHLIDHGELGVIGAACWFAGQHLLAKPAALS